jgi:hypothetical protein
MSSPLRAQTEFRIQYEKSDLAAQGRHDRAGTNRYRQIGDPSHPRRKTQKSAPRFRGALAFSGNPIVGQC